MTIDLRHQIGTYARDLDSQVDRIDVADLIAAEPVSAGVALQGRRSRPLLAVGIAFVTVLVTIGVTALLPRSEPVPGVTTAVVTTTHAPSSTVTDTSDAPQQPPTTGSIASDPDPSPKGSWVAVPLAVPHEWSDGKIWAWAQRVASLPDGGGLVISSVDDAAFGTYGSAINLSVDGREWDQVSSDLPVFDVVSTSAGLVAHGIECDGPDRQDCRFTLWSSFDGRTWSQEPVDSSVFQDCVGVRPAGACGMQVTVGTDGAAVMAAGFDRGAMVEGRFEGEGAASDTLVVWFSADGLAWERRAELPIADVDVSHVVRVEDTWLVFLNGYYSGGTELGTRVSLLASSDEGHTWEPRYVEDWTEETWISDVTVGVQGAVAVGNAGRCGRPTAWLSKDGVSWSRHDLGPAGQTCVYPFLSVTMVDGRYVAGTIDGLVWWSDDGQQWIETLVPELADATWVDLGSWNGLVVAPGYHGVADPPTPKIWVWMPADSP